MSRCTRMKSRTVRGVLGPIESAVYAIGTLYLPVDSQDTVLEPLGRYHGLTDGHSRTGGAALPWDVSPPQSPHGIGDHSGARIERSPRHHTPDRFVVSS